ncbi:MAG: long-chain-fatty-acid--CoA ligase [Candidatus Bathyarchaeota archaeon]
MMDYYQLNLIDTLSYAARNFPDREIVSKRFDGSLFRYNYSEAFKRVCKLANALELLGVQAGDRVGIICVNTHRYFECVYGISGIGAVPVLINFRLHPTDVIYIMNHSNVKTVFLDEIFIQLAENIAPAIKAENHVIMTDREELPEAKLSRTYNYEKLIREQSDKYNFPMIDENSACTAYYTTGTTGRPKGVYYSHRSQLIHNFIALMKWGLSCEDCCLNLTPMFHAAGTPPVLMETQVGAKQVFPGLWSIADLKPIVDIMINENVTAAVITVPILHPLYHYLVRLPGEMKSKIKLRKVLTGATAPPPELIKGLMKDFNVKVIQVYGATETCPIVTYSELWPELERKLDEEGKLVQLSKQGMPAPFIKLKIIDFQGKEVPKDGKTMGEIVVSGPWVVNSYYNDPRTAESFIGEWLDRWWRTGDVGVMDEYGFVKLIDRVKDVIKSGGEWISSVDMENWLMGHPKVFEACVIGVPHQKWGERPLALVIPKPEYQDKVTKEELYEHLKQKFARWQLPDDIVFVSEIPKTSVGKFSKVSLREAYKNFYTTK